MTRPGARHGPPWWPEGEPWPPRGGSWQGGRSHFVRRVALFFGCLILVMFALALAAGALAAAVLDHRGPPIQAVFPLLGIVVLAGVFVAALRWLRATAAPIGEVMDAAARVAEGDYAIRVEERGPGDVRALARSFNAMTARLEENDTRRRALLADVSHELRNPLSVVRGTVEGVLDGIYPPTDAHLRPVLDEVDVMARLIEDLSLLSSAESGVLQLHLEPTDLGELVQGVVASFAARAEVKSVALTADLPGFPELELDPVRIREVLANVVENALRYTPGGGRIVIAGGIGSEAIWIAVVDNGPGIPANQIDRVFERFTKATDSGGSGLGLAIARSLIQAHGGEIAAASEPGHGTTIRLTIPIQPRPA